MKRILFTVVFCLVSLSLFGQSQHGVQLSWTENDPSFPSITYNVYRLNAACPTSGTSGFAKVNTAAIAAETYFDPNPVPTGSIGCYYVTAVANSQESAPSPTVQVTFSPPPFSPSVPTATVK